MEVSVVLKGGLGNQLFQLAFLYTIARRQNATPVIYEGEIHKRLGVERRWGFEIRSGKCPFKRVRESANAPCVYVDYSPTSSTIFEGYFQSAKFFTRDVRLLILEREIAHVDAYFVHVRGGDYVGHPVHHLKNIDAYYRECVQHIGVNKRFLVFTNDKCYAKSLSFLTLLPNVEFSDANEQETLALMAACKGGVCANSSFSWWGAWLNGGDIYMPDPWFASKNLKYDDIYFENVNRVKI